MGSIPTRSRHLSALLLLALATGAAPATARAQDSLVVDSVPPAPAPAPAADSVAADVAEGLDDSLRQGPSPTGALLKSLVLPGLGQLSLGRELTAGVFIALEAGTLAMVISSQRDLNAANTLGDQVAIDDAKRKREDWLVLMGMNHVLSALEAYISAHFWDFPAELDLRAAPGGGFSAGATVPFRLR